MVIWRGIASCSWLPPRCAKTSARWMRWGWGGDELLVVLRQVDAAELAVSAETLRSLVASSHILIEEEILQVTVSAGATLIRPDEDPQAALQRADELLYRSKQSGRNRCFGGAVRAGEDSPGKMEASSSQCSTTHWSISPSPVNSRITFPGMNTCTGLNDKYWSGIDCSNRMQKN